MSGAILKPSKMPRGMWVYVGSRGVPRPGPGSISRGLRASDVAGGHRASDVGQRQAASAKACTHRTWHVRIGQATSANDGQHQPRVARIKRGLCTTLSRRRAWPARIALLELIF